MVIKYSSTDQKSFYTLNTGDTFSFKGDIFMKVFAIDVMQNAVQLQSGKLVHINLTDKVQLLDTVLTVGGTKKDSTQRVDMSEALKKIRLRGWTVGDTKKNSTQRVDNRLEKDIASLDYIELLLENFN